MTLQLLTGNDQKEQLSLAYVAAIAAKSGFTVSVPTLDRDSIDIHVSSRSSRRASVQFQLKATSSPSWGDAELKFQLKAKNYNDLVVRRQVPLLLAVMVLPFDPVEWVLVDNDALCLKQCVWWTSLVGESPTDQGSMQVALPLTNLLTPEAMHDLIRRSEENTL